MVTPNHDNPREGSSTSPPYVVEEQTEQNSEGLRKRRFFTNAKDGPGTIAVSIEEDISTMEDNKGDSGGADKVKSPIT